MDTSGRTVAIIVAAGSGTRAGEGKPKQFRTVAGKSLVAHCRDRFVAHPAIDVVMLVVAAGQENAALAALGGGPVPVFVIGGDSRRGSVRNALRALAESGPPSRVLVHDAARPFVSAAIIDRLLAALENSDGAVPVIRVVDTVARIDGNALGDTLARDELRRVQTPQAFNFATLVEAHDAWPEGEEATDDAQMVRAIGRTVAMVEGDEALRKFTHAADFEGETRAPRIGFGYDVHRLAEGEELWLCGIQIDHDYGLAGHSDADVAIHALVDAILGAAAAGDIGEHFPPSDPQWRGASSDIFLAHAMLLAREAGFALGNADVTIICEAPKIGPYRAAMRAKLATILGVDITSVSVKATTTEKLGPMGRGEGIAAQAVVSLMPV